ncbi:hypothetical protein WI38_32760 [Burkholderia ubonensis]|uniref:Uncharacterized protein n=1 Tax=Burkholderia ubonensis TaxID=101571 RepID=A0A117XZF1_9BURK|nr:hypothetical protein [Burkholderia ubonensis]KUZ70696.1 hypothetical protein WI35_15575 [Burkholderia ubonensis]KUZ80952.1 hypothetical protein WI38_32760 [Burkholderia ubonensis]KVA02722.1 hypothetical protein WI39_33030 [Burkholderia ubonensis]
MDIQEIRRTKLKEWAQKHGVPAREKSYFSQLMNGTASFGERAARRIERDYGMPTGLLDGRDALAQSRAPDAKVPEENRTEGIDATSEMELAIGRLVRAVADRSPAEIERIASALEVLLHIESPTSGASSSEVVIPPPPRKGSSRAA